MDQTLFKKITKYIYDECGITLNDTKKILVESRLMKRMRRLKINTYEEYFSFVKSDESETEKIHMIDVISTNVTHFFREMPHFDFFENDMKNRVAAGQKSFRIWCAAASTGEEPYSIAMVLHEVTKRAYADCRILATDISTNVLKKCKEGVYSVDSVKSIPRPLLQESFSKQKVDGKEQYQVKAHLAEMLTFARLNLAKPPFPMSGPFDVVFIRNVMIYFDNRVKQNLLEDVHRLLRPGGHLIIGHSESMAANLIPGFKRVENSVFIKL